MKNPHAVALGSIKSDKKAKTSRENGRLSVDNRPHVIKVSHFEGIFPHPLVSNEWRDKFSVGVTPTGRVATYNPDYFCPSMDCYIEVTTSKPNMAEQGWKWTEAINRGLKLKIYWWEGNDITNQFNGKKGGRPKKTLPEDK